ncbi:hypothetical protein ACOMHN_061676 [Nucella lapillus]
MLVAFVNGSDQIITPAGSSVRGLREHMTENELADCLGTLLDLQPEGGASMGQAFDPSQTASLIERLIPPQISAPAFLTDILGCCRGKEPPVAPSGEQSVVPTLSVKGESS